MFLLLVLIKESSSSSLVNMRVVPAILCPVHCEAVHLMFMVTLNISQL